MIPALSSLISLTQSDVGMVKVVMMEDGRSQARIRHVTNQQWPAGGEKTDYYCCVQVYTYMCVNMHTIKVETFESSSTESL